MGELLSMRVAGVPVFYAVPLLVFLPLFVIIVWRVVGLRDMLFPPPEIKEARARLKEEERAEKARLKERRKRAGDQIHMRRKVALGPMQWAGQAVTYALFAVGIGYFSNAPDYAAIAPDHALIKVSLSHPGQRKEECRKRTREELMKLPPNMRAPQKCSRERWPVFFEMELDGELLYRDSVKPAGLAKDGHSNFYHTLAVPAGPHSLTVRMRDRGDTEDFNHVFAQDVTLQPEQVLVVGFASDTGTITLR